MLLTTEEKCEKVLELVNDGQRVIDACKTQGIHNTTFYGWRSREKAKLKRRTTKPIITLPIDNGGQVTFNVKDFAALCRELVRGDHA